MTGASEPSSEHAEHSVSSFVRWKAGHRSGTKDRREVNTRHCAEPLMSIGNDADALTRSALVFIEILILYTIHPF